ncbi:hypothetical protein GGR51DRAFT_536482 [Nemania sp. FL0031]|nr:hypothetical protein GGR51DRAFT_536482 [Nemania sp. FL0031]
MHHFPGLQSPLSQEVVFDTSTYGGNASLVSVLEVHKSSKPAWHRDLNHTGLLELLDQDTFTFEGSIKVFFVSGVRAENEVKLDKAILESLVSKAGMSEKFRRDISNTEYWAKLHIGTSIVPGAAWPPSVTFHYGFWAWGDDTSHSFVECQTNLNDTRYFCINFPKDCVKSVVQATSQNAELSNKIFYVDSLVLSHVVSTYLEAISGKRSMLKSIEKERAFKQFMLPSKTEELHSLCMDWHSIHSDLMDLAEQLHALRELYDILFRERNALEKQQQGIMGCDHTLRMLQSQCNSYGRWTKNYLDRTNIRINLLQHIASHIDSDNSTKIARQSQQESKSMLVLSVVTTFFLPGTFIATILSTAFFNVNDGILEVAGKWWILLAAAIPLTIVVAFFLVWIHHFNKNGNGGKQKSMV